MIIFLDFDDVLFNTKKFKKDYFYLFKERGVSKSVFEKFYYDPLDKRNTKTYSPADHIERICNELHLDCSEFKKAIKIFTQNTSSYVFQDVIEFLKNFSKKELYLISFSKTNFQKSKIINSGLAKYFNQIKIIDELKGEAIKEIIKAKVKNKNEKIYFVDDRVEHLADAKMKNPQIRTIFFLRKEGRHHDKKNNFCDYAAKSTDRILKIIKTK